MLLNFVNALLKNPHQLRHCYRRQPQHIRQRNRPHLTPAYPSRLLTCQPCPFSTTARPHLVLSLSGVRPGTVCASAISFCRHFLPLLHLGSSCSSPGPSRKTAPPPADTLAKSLRSSVSYCKNSAFHSLSSLGRHQTVIYLHWADLAKHFSGGHLQMGVLTPLHSSKPHLSRLDTRLAG